MKILKFIKKWWWIVPLDVIASYALAVAVSVFLNRGWDITTLADENTGKFLLVFLLVSLVSALVWYSSHYWMLNGKKVMEESKGDKDLNSILEHSHFQTKEEMQKNFKTVSWEALPSFDYDGAIVQASVKERKRKNQLEVVFAKPSHTLIIGTTGSGKTTTYVSPCIQIFSRTELKPSMFITDPKGELYALHAEALRDRGYNVKVLDLRHPYLSVRWNPLQHQYRLYQRALHLQEEVKEREDGTFLFDGNAYADKASLDGAIQVLKQTLNDEVYENLNDIACAICPVKSKNDPIWESGAQKFILAIMLAMLEDSESPELGMTEEKFNFFSLMKIATNTGGDDCQTLKDYFAGRPPLSKATSMAKQVINAGDKTRSSYLSTVYDKLQMFSDQAICALTSSNEIEFGRMGDEPTALFLQIPDEKETRHALASMVLMQGYKDLVARANENPDKSLPRPVHFILDEFGNLPAVNKLEAMITVGRSRKIWMSLVVQSYAQLSKTYGNESADIIKSNCNVQVFIGTTDQKTIEDFSKACGNYTVVQRGISYSMGKGKGDDGLNTSSSLKERPLIYPVELKLLNSPGNMGNAIVTIFGYYPLKSKWTPAFDLEEIYALGNAGDEVIAPRPFEEERAFYDSTQRNKIVIGDRGEAKEKGRAPLRRGKGVEIPRGKIVDDETIGRKNATENLLNKMRLEDTLTKEAIESETAPQKNREESQEIPKEKDDSTNGVLVDETYVGAEILTYLGQKGNKEEA